MNRKNDQNNFDKGIEKLHRDIKRYTLFYRIAKIVFWVLFFAIIIWMLSSVNG
jgi:t-SNARE complex subunit (syntaxin)